MLFFKRKKRKKITNFIPSNITTSVYCSDYINTIYDACRSCYNIKDKNATIEEKLTYIEKRVKCGHDSILEHSNIVICISNPTKDILDSIGQLTSMNSNPTKYLKIMYSINNNSLYVSGSIRGYKHLISNVSSINVINNNMLCNIIVTRFLKHIPRELYIDLIEKDLALFHTYEVSYVYDYSFPNYRVIFDNDDKIEITAFDLMNNIIDKSPLSEVDINDLLEMSSITVLFKNMSRTATHQLVRHRNAITQESQRYTDYSNAEVTVPDISYVQKDTFNIKLNGVEKEYTLYELGKELRSVYKQLREQGLKKEDARSYLPSNVQCSKLYMTFTLSNLFKFFELRCESHAQAEIRSYAIDLLNMFTEAIIREYNKHKDDDWIKNVLLKLFDYIGYVYDKYEIEMSDTIEEFMFSLHDNNEDLVDEEDTTEDDNDNEAIEVIKEEVIDDNE